MNLDELKRVEAISSTMKLFENIFRYAENQNPNDPTWGLSDSLGIDRSKSALRDIVLSFLPKDMGKEAKKIAQFAVSDVSN